MHDSLKKLILASNSPRRQELLSLLGLPFVVIPADIDESQKIGEAPVPYVRRMAIQKAMVVAESKDGLVIAADTVVVDSDELLGKPKNKADARRMLTQLRNRVHQVFTGIAVVDLETRQSYDFVCQTDVQMRDYSDTEIDAYIATGDPMDKAGAYAIQHAGFRPVENYQGCFASVMGLPLCHLAIGLKKFDVQIPEDHPVRCQALLDYTCPIFDDILNDA